MLAASAAIIMDGGSAANMDGLSIPEDLTKITATSLGFGSGSIPPPMRHALSVWGTFIDKCLRDRLDTVRFESFARLIYAKHRLPPAAIADLFLRPTPKNEQSLDPRIPLYLNTLGTLGYVDTPSLLKALYKYSSSHALVESQQAMPQKDAHQENKHEDRPFRWKNSYWAEDHIFYALTKWVVEGRAIKDTQAALEMVRIISKWVALFTAASAAFAADLLGQMQKAQVEMESSRAGLVAVLMCFRENPVLLNAISKPRAKRDRKVLAQNLANFVPTLHLGNSITEKDILEKLEHFRTVTLASLDPIDEKKQAADATMNEMLDSAMGLEHYVVDEIPVANTRAGLYIHLSALVSPSALTALFQY